MITWTITKDRNLILSINKQEYIIPASDHRYKHLLKLISDGQDEKIVEFFFDNSSRVFYNDEEDDMC